MRSLNPVRRSRRGAAMLLVIISLMMATILTTAYVSSRDNSGLIGVNAGHGATARAAAITGLDMAAAMMQTKTNWRTAATAGVLLDDVPVGGGAVTVRAVDELTKNAPTAASEYFMLTSTGVIGDVEETATARVYAPADGGNTVDVDLSDFAVFVREKLEMTNQALITRWPMSPLQRTGDRVSVGVQSVYSCSVLLTGSSAAIDTSVYCGPGASSSLVSVASGPAVKTVPILDLIPMPAAPNVGVPATVATPVPADSVQNGGSGIVMSNARYRKLEVTNNGVRTFQGNIRIVTEEDLKVTGGGKIVINGNVKLAVFGKFEMDEGAIELASSATLTLFVRGGGASTALRIRDSYIGDSRINTVRDNSGNAKYFNPAQITIYSIPPTSSRGEWLIERNSVIKGSMYCPDASKVTITDQSALYGRVATEALIMCVDAAVFYDPRLDSRAGYATITSPVYNADGTIVSACKSLVSLDFSNLQAVADACGKTVRGISSSSSDITPTTALPADTETDDGTGVTLRPVHINYELLTLSSNVHAWETGANSAGMVAVAAIEDLSDAGTTTSSN